jgi:hypothetical protein
MPGIRWETGAMQAGIYRRRRDTHTQDADIHVPSGIQTRDSCLSGLSVATDSNKKCGWEVRTTLNTMPIC